MGFKSPFKMFSMASGGKAFITLNILRVMNIISLVEVIAASWIMLVMTVKTSNFFFFDAVSHFITSTIGMFLVVSELNLFRRYFRKYWPLLSPESGLIALGLAMFILGFNILGNLNKPATSVETLGLPMWRVVISAGVLTAVLGIFNCIASVVFGNRKEAITSRQIRSHGAAAASINGGSAKSFNLGKESISRSASSSTPQERRRTIFGMRLPISKPIPQEHEESGSAKWDERSSPIVPEMQRPPTAFHPAFHPPAPAPSSRYSEVSDMTRF